MYEIPTLNLTEKYNWWQSRVFHMNVRILILVWVVVIKDEIGRTQHFPLKFCLQSAAPCEETPGVRATHQANQIIMVDTR